MTCRLFATGLVRYGGKEARQDTPQIIHKCEYENGHSRTNQSQQLSEVAVANGR